MFKNLPLSIGLRYTRSKRREGFVSFISGFSLFAMALGVMALIVVLSVMNGFDREIKQRLLQVVPHITGRLADGITGPQIQQLEQLLVADGASVSAVVPMVQSFALLSRADEQTGVMVQGFDRDWPRSELLAEGMLSGHMEQLQAGEFGIVLGAQVARKLGLFVGDKLQLSLPAVTVTPAGVFPRIKSVQVTGIFQVGAQVDASLGFMHQQDMRRLLQLGDRYQGVQVQMHNAYLADQWLAKTSNPEIQWRSWTQEMGTLFQAMRMEKLVVSLLLSVIVAVAAFNIVASLVLMVADKRRDIAVVRTLGATSELVMKIFVVQGMAVGLMGILVGTVAGCLLAYFIGDIVSLFEAVTGVYLFDPSVYLISALPSKIVFGDVVMVVGSATLISFIATIYPAWRAGQVLPAEALRYER
ncbi:lipoprotein-releasing ABC transporter permease subunit [Porticoccaceae bacterium]|jgi:lipoprotein-releasing system permease protein|nr:lipoprotein-releasing ABC transporter permease subunit [Porticoccaceae bacterium]